MNQEYDSERNCDADCLHSKACDEDYLDQLKENGLACMDCNMIFEESGQRKWSDVDGVICVSCRNVRVQRADTEMK